MEVHDPARELWDYASGFLPPRLDELARDSGALIRCRGVSDAQSLLRILLCCAMPGSSFRTASAWASSAGFAQISAEGLFYRMKLAEPFLNGILGSLLLDWRNISSSRRLVLMDASILTGPGSKGVDFRLHASYDPVRSVPLEFLLTDVHTGETLANFDLRPGDLAVADRGYGHFRGFVAALGQGADVLVRLTPEQMKLTDDSGQKVSLKNLQSELPMAGPKSFHLNWHGPVSGNLPLRVIGLRTRDDGVCWLGTNLGADELPDEEAAAIYAYRWQVELLFKRLKSQLKLGELRSREGPTSRALILAKLVVAVLSLRLAESRDFSPYGYPAQSLARIPVRSQCVIRRNSRSRAMDTRHPLASLAG